LTVLCPKALNGKATRPAHFGSLEMKEYFVSYCPPDEKHCLCRCPVGELTDEQVEKFKHQSDIYYMPNYVLHSADDLSLGEIENKRVHLAALEQYDIRLTAVAHAVSRLKVRGWIPPQPTSDSILRTFAQNAPPEEAQIFLSNGHVEFMLQCQNIAYFIRNPDASSSTDTQSITEYSVRHYRETQDVAEISSMQMENAAANSLPFPKTPSVIIAARVNKEKESADKTTFLADLENDPIVNAPDEMILKGIDYGVQEALGESIGRNIALWLEKANIPDIRNKIREDVYVDLGFSPSEVVDLLYPAITPDDRRTKAQAISKRNSQKKKTD